MLGGAENFFNSSCGGSTYQDEDYYAEFTKEGYSVVQNATAMSKLDNSNIALGIFSVSNMAEWLDRNIYTNNVENQNNSADGLKKDATDQPGLREMTLKAIDIVHS